MGDLLRLVLASMLTIQILASQAGGASEIDAGEIEDKILRGEAVDYNDVIVQGDLNLSKLGLPSASDSKKTVLCSIRITNSTIDGIVDFSKTILRQPVNLGGTEILEKASFRDSQFDEFADFQGCRFRGPADFYHAGFNGDVNFEQAEFNGADFQNAQFNGSADFADARFNSSIFYGRSASAVFWSSRFYGRADFTGALFNGDPAFLGSRFYGRADFAGALFNESASFGLTEFTGDANFAATKFNGKVNFLGAKFKGKVSIEGAVFRDPDDPMGARMLYNLAGQTLPGDMAIDHASSYPKVKLSLFIDTPCAKTGALQAEDFSVQEEDKDVAVERFYFTGNASGQSLDLAVVFDRSGSMREEISVMESRVQGLIDQINRSGMDGRYSLVTFGDDLTVGTRWTFDPRALKSAVKAIVPESGGDEPEVALDAIEAVASMGFRPEARKVMLVVTDAPAHRRGDGTEYSKWTLEAVKDDLLASGVMLVVVSPVLKKKASYVDLRDLADSSQGLWLDMGLANFSGILDKFTSIITETYVIEYGKVDWDEYTPEVAVTVKSPGCANGSITRSYISKEHPDLLPYRGIRISELNESEQETYIRIHDRIHPSHASPMSWLSRAQALMPPRPEELISPPSL